MLFFLNAGGRERQSKPNIRNVYENLDKVGIKSVYYDPLGIAHE